MDKKDLVSLSGTEVKHRRRKRLLVKSPTKPSQGCSPFIVQKQRTSPDLEIISPTDDIKTSNDRKKVLLLNSSDVRAIGVLRLSFYNRTWFTPTRLWNVNLCLINTNGPGIMTCFMLSFI